MEEIDPKGRLGELGVICSLEQEKIEATKNKIVLLKTESAYKTDLEKRLLILKAKQAERKSEFNKLSLEQAVSSSQEETNFNQN